MKVFLSERAMSDSGLDVLTSRELKHKIPLLQELETLGYAVPMIRPNTLIIPPKQQHMDACKHCCHSMHSCSCQCVAP